jgi:pimeloyl-ACP methyl ester carboxylesterase
MMKTMNNILSSIFVLTAVFMLNLLPMTLQAQSDGPSRPTCEPDNPFTFEQGTTTPLDPDLTISLRPEGPPRQGEQAEVVNLYWLHGLGGNATAWEKAALATDHGATGFPGRKSLSRKPYYTLSASTLSTAAHELKGKAEFDVTGKPFEEIKDNYMIAHSQGGLVGRYLDHQFQETESFIPRPFYGLVTFGSPHQGAYIVNSLLEVGPDGSTRAERMTDEACRALGPGKLLWDLIKIKQTLPKKAKFFLYNIPGGFPLDPVTISEYIAEEFCSIIPSVLNFTMSGILGQPLGPGHMVNDYPVGGPAIAEMAGFNTPTRKVAFYGIKDPNHDSGELFWRTYHYLHVSPNAYPFFTANSEHEKLTLELVHAITAQYRERMEYFLAQSEKYYKAAQKYHNPIYVMAWLDYYYASWLYKNGYDWLTNMDNTWRVIIGAQELTPSISYKCCCLVEPDPWNPGPDPWSVLNFGLYDCMTAQDLNDCAPFFAQYASCYTEQTITLHTTYKQSDGIVLAESAMNFDGASHSERMEDTSHMQMRNNQELKLKLLKLYDMDDIEDGWFNIPIW